MERIYPWTFLGGHHQMIGFGWMLGHQPITERKSKIEGGYLHPDGEQTIEGEDRLYQPYL